MNIHNETIKMTLNICNIMKNKIRGREWKWGSEHKKYFYYLEHLVTKIHLKIVLHKIFDENLILIKLINSKN